MLIVNIRTEGKSQYSKLPLQVPRKTESKEKKRKVGAKINKTNKNNRES